MRVAKSVMKNERACFPQFSRKPLELTQRQKTLLDLGAGNGRYSAYTLRSPGSGWSCVAPLCSDVPRRSNFLLMLISLGKT